jgi:hypothetical protein
MILNRSLSQALRSTMIEMVRYGDLKGCLNAVLRVIEDADESETLKAHAAAAIRDMGDDGSRRRLAEIAKSAQKIPNRLCGLYCEAIYPVLITAGELVSLLKKTEPVGIHSFGIRYELKNHFSRTIDGADAGDLLKSLIDLATTEPHISNVPSVRISQQFSWVVELLPTALLTLLGRSALSEYESEVASDALGLIAEFRQHSQFLDESLDQLNGASLEHSSIRKLSFWRMVADFRSKFHFEPVRPAQVFDFYEVLRPDARDFDWFLPEIRGRVNEQDRYLALHFAVEYAGADWKKWLKIWPAVRHDKLLRRRQPPVRSLLTWS